MNTVRFTFRRAHAWLRTGAFAFTLAACGGGVDSGGTGGAATYASGPISGFGSVIVNGVRFDDNSASVSDEDGVRNRSELRLGMVVEVRGGTIDNSSGTPKSIASSISFSSELVGPVEATPLAGATSLLVFGQTVDVKTTTVFENTGGLTTLQAGDVVEVYGLLDSITGRYTATRIERKAGTVTEFRIRGKVNGLSSVQMIFTVGGQTISYASTSEVPTGLSDGMLVRVLVNSAPSAGGAWRAIRVRGGTSSPDNGSHAKVEGLLSAFTSIRSFSVDGVAVTTTSGTTQFPDGEAFNVGDRVEVEGTMVNGVLVASKVELETDSGTNEFDFRGPIEAVNTGALTITLAGFTISYAGAEFRPNGKSAADLVLVPPANVEVKATLVNGNQYQATRIEFK